MGSREEHATAAEIMLKAADGKPVKNLAAMQIEAAKVEATLALAAAISEIAQNLYKIGH